MINDATDRLLNRVQKYLWLQGLIDRAWSGLILTTGILCLTAVLHIFQTPMAVSWWGPLSLFPIAVAIFVTILSRPSMDESAQTADRWFNSHNLFSTSVYLRSQASSMAPATVHIVLEQAELFANGDFPQLAHLRKSRHPLPTTLVVAITAISLFFLSLQGASSPDKLIPPMPTPGEYQLQNPATQDDWLSIFESGSQNAPKLVEDKTPAPSSSTGLLKSSNEHTSRVSALPVESGLNEASARTPPIDLAPVAGTGTGTGQLGSSTRPQPGSINKATDPAVTPIEIEFVDLPRKPDRKDMVIDHATSIELTPYTHNTVPAVASGTSVAAAQVAKQAFSTKLGPAHRALQLRYLEETSHDD